MPYITKDVRNQLDNKINDLVNVMDCSIDHYNDNKGKINYIITKIIHHFITSYGKRYATLNDAIGILECAKIELYRHIIGPYEDKKISENGDIII